MAPVAPRKPVDGASCTTLAPPHEAIRAHVLAAERLHGDDTTVPVLARKKTVTGRIWTYVRDVSHANATGPREHGETLRRQRPAGGTLPLLPRPWRHSPPGHLAGWSGILQADAYAGFNALHAKGRAPAPVTDASF